VTDESRRASRRYPPGTFQDRALGRVKVWDKLVLDLGTARAGELVNIQGDFLYLDQDSTGKIYVQLNSDRAIEPAMPLTSNAGLQRVPFESIYITHAAQPGDTVNLWYGWDANIIPPNQDIASIGEILEPVTVEGAPSLVRALAGQSYHGSVLSPATSSQRSRVRINNPPGSGKMVVIQQVFATVGGNGEIKFEANLTGNLSNTVGGIFATQKNDGGALYSGEARFSHETSVASFSNSSRQFFVVSGNPFRLLDGDPIILPENRTLTVWCTTVNTALSVTFDWFEVDL
jgi:hypothetical protein